MRFFITIAVALCLTGCAAVMGGSPEQFSVTDTVLLRAKPRNFVASVEAVGTSLGYKVAGIDKAANQVTLRTSSSPVSMALIGKISQFQIDVSLNPDGKTVDLRVLAIGNWSSADREKVEKRIADFKAALVARAS